MPGYTNMFVLFDIGRCLMHATGVIGLYIDLGKRISARRKRCELSQAVFAEQVGLTRTSISNIENGRQHLPLHQLYKFAEVLRCSPQELLPEAGAVLRAEEPEVQLAAKTDRTDLRQFLSNIQNDRAHTKG
jgi:transcriptional regulator with XRE-family HTH domain